ncbi:hypothetical protein LIER_09777 [Lithospermum erythrorhizon]|uniref:Uncharacterized protein n=1 Tax=Lithospermum erythrorhizon TaxID=34254 RepID=A0AAV3PH39_LITER
MTLGERRICGEVTQLTPITKTGKKMNAWRNYTANSYDKDRRKKKTWRSYSATSHDKDPQASCYMCEEVEENPTTKKQHRVPHGSPVPQPSQKMLHRKKWAVKINHQPVGTINLKSVFQKLGTNNQEENMVFKRLGATSQASVPKRSHI